MKSNLTDHTKSSQEAKEMEKKGKYPTDEELMKESWLLCIAKDEGITPEEALKMVRDQGLI